VIIGYFLLMTPESSGPLIFVSLGAGTGVIIGAIYAIQVRNSRVFRAEAKIIAGASASAFVGGVLRSALGSEWYDL
jgi:hypothetical protein